MTIFDRQTVIEWRARTIENPIDRLKFLRKQMGPGLRDAGPPEVGPLWRGRFVRELFERRGWFLPVLMGLLVVVFVPAYNLSHSEPGPLSRPVILPPHAALSSETSDTGVWLVDRKGEIETYSNGLRIENRYEVGNEPRGRYVVYARAHPDTEHASWLERPAGIVYHTTESHQAPLEAGHNKVLQRIGENVRESVRQNRSYHFLIDRFGRVFRVVQEEDVAFHAGHSVWADDQHVYIGLNTSFIGIAFETETRQGQDFTSANPAQVHAGQVLTAMLRNKYGIAAANCVTHAQVSVNPSNGLIGYHTDWAANFPFHELGLRDNYMEPPVSIVLFGFGYDAPYLQSTGARMLPGLLRAEEQVREEAARRGMPVRAYKKLQQKNFAQMAAQSRTETGIKENANAK